MATLLHVSSRPRPHERMGGFWPSADGMASRFDDEIQAMLHGLRDALRADAALSCHHSGRPYEASRILGRSGGDEFEEEDWEQLGLLVQAADRRVLPASARSDDHDWVTALLRLRMYQVLRLSVPDPESPGRIVLALLYDKGRPTNGVASLLEKLRPALEAHFRLWQRQQLTTNRAAGLRNALNTIDGAVFVIDRSGKVRDANAAAEALIEQGDYLRRSDDTLAASDLADSIALQVAINDALTASVSSDPATRRMPTLSLRSSRHDRPLIVTVVPCENSGHRDCDAAALVYAIGPDTSFDAQAQAVCKLYGLSQVETRLALLIVGGASLQKAAIDLHIKEQTARSYLKQVFLKTDTRRQADLVRVILTSVFPLRTSLPAEAINRR